MRPFIIASLSLFCAVASAEGTIGVDPRIPGVTVDDALEAVKQIPDIAVSTTPNGWFKALERGGRVRWLFAPIGHPARPAVIRQSVAGGGSVELSVKCQAAPRDCRRLIDEFTIENERLKLRGVDRLE